MKKVVSILVTIIVLTCLVSSISFVAKVRLKNGDSAEEPRTSITFENHHRITICALHRWNMPSVQGKEASGNLHPRFR